MNISRSSFQTWRKVIALLCTASLPLQTIFALEQETYQTIARQYLPNFGSLEKALMREQMGVAELDEYEKRQVVCEIFKKQSESKNNGDNQILTRNAWKDLNLFESVSSEESINLVSLLNNTSTLMGEIKLAQMLTNPTIDITLLKKRQALIQELMRNETLADDLEMFLKDIKDAEEPFLSFWRLRDEDQFNQIYLMVKKQDTCSKSMLISEMKVRFFDFLQVIFPTAYFAWIASQLHISKEQLQTIFTTVVNSLKSDDDLMQKIKVVGLPIAGLLYVLILHVVSFYQAHGRIKLMQTLRKKMHSVSEFVLTMDDITQMVAKNTAVSRGLTTFTNQGGMLSAACAHDNSLAWFMSHLESWAIQSTAYLTHFCTPVGRALAAYKQMKDEKHKFAPLMECVGELDACLSMAKLVKKISAHEGAAVCFPEFLEQDSGELEINGMWNPFIDQQRAITNDIALGDRFETPNMIVTGPNAGGKSTVLKGIVLNVILAQTFGIAMAEQMRLTPYSKICTHLNIIDQSGIKSLFQAEVGRAQELIETIGSLPEGEFALTIMDEVFNGTNPVEGEAAAFSIGEYVTQFKNSNCIIATHFPRLTLLPKYTNNRFKNFKVFVNKIKSGSFTYSYKFVEGTADQRIAIDILEAEGFDTNILTRARDIIANPDKYSVK